MCEGVEVGSGIADDLVRKRSGKRTAGLFGLAAQIFDKVTLAAACVADAEAGGVDLLDEIAPLRALFRVDLQSGQREDQHGGFRNIFNKLHQLVLFGGGEGFHIQIGHGHAFVVGHKGQGFRGVRDIIHRSIVRKRVEIELREIRVIEFFCHAEQVAADQHFFFAV